MGFKIKLEIDRASLKKALDAQQKLIWNNIQHIIRNEAVPALVDKIMQGYDNLAGISEQLPEDPTSLNKWRTEFKRHLEEDVLETIAISDNTIRFQMGDKSFLGYADGGQTNPQDDTPLVWMVYYLEGLAGDWGFVTPELYDKFRGNGAYQSDWGRFGQGFLISQEQFSEEGWGSVVSFEEIRHPFSGFSPVDIFKEAIDEFLLRPFIEKAIKSAAEGREL